MVVSLTSRYRALIDQANEAKDRQTCFYYLKQAEQLLQAQSQDRFSVQSIASLASSAQIQQAA
jgi:hypothetical protein